MTPHVIFKEEHHKYEFPHHPERVAISGTKFVGEFQEEFDREFWLTVKACQKVLPDYKQLEHKWTVEFELPKRDPLYIEFLLGYADIEDVMYESELLGQQWDDKGKKTSEMGTREHLNKELDSYERGWEINKMDGKKYKVHQKKAIVGCDNYSLANNLSELEDGYYPELLVFWEDLVGQADRAFIGTDKWGRYIDISDYKFFEKLTKRGFYDKHTRKYQMFKSPIDHIEDCKLNKTALQISTYLWCLENHGLQVRYASFIHCQPGKETVIKLPYLKAEVEAMYKTYPWPQLKTQQYV